MKFDFLFRLHVILIMSCKINWVTAAFVVSMLDLSMCPVWLLSVQINAPSSLIGVLIVNFLLYGGVLNWAGVVTWQWAIIFVIYSIYRTRTNKAPSVEVSTISHGDQAFPGDAGYNPCKPHAK